MVLGTEVKCNKKILLTKIVFNLEICYMKLQIS